MDEGYLPPSWKEGVISTLFKKGDVTRIENRRPITLLKVDYKILSKILTSRLLKVFPDLINNYQIGFVPDRLIYDNVLVLDQLIQLRVKGLLIDFEKAYDSAAHAAFSTILRHIKVPEKFHNLVMAMIQGSSARVRLGNSLTESFNIGRGVKQGDPLSPLLFNLVIEVLSRAGTARVQDPPTINNIPVPLTMYADDTSLFALSDHGIIVWKDILIEFQEGVGLKFHPGKSFGLNCEVLSIGIKEMVEIFMHLGFNFHPVKGLVRDYDQTILQVENRLRKWNSHSFSIFTRVAILKSYALACLWFKAFLIGENPKAIQKIQESFLWASRGGIRKRTMVSRKRATQPSQCGGISAWNLEARLLAFKANMIEKIRFNQSMKAHAIWKDKLDTSSPNFWKNSPATCLMDELIASWKRFHKPESDTTVYKSIKTLQSMWAPPSDPIWTEKQLLMTNNVGARNIFMSIKKTKWRRLAFFAWKYFQGSLVFPRFTCACQNVQGKTTHHHLLFECQIGDLPWESVADIAEHFMDYRLSFSNEYDIWHTCNDATIPPQVKLAIFCGIMARWINRWAPPFTPSTQLLRTYMTEAASADLDVSNTIYDETTRNLAITATFQRWQVPVLFKHKYTSLIMQLFK